MMDTSIYLGIVRSSDHSLRLAEVAAWLDTNKFSCTLSVVDGRATLDITDDRDMSQQDFEKYAMEIVIHTLVKHMDT